jgi:predicted alpha/beta superfamily hydrolase
VASAAPRYFRKELNMSAVQQARLLFTEVHLLKSEEIGQDFVVSIALPPSYFDKPKQDYPAIYLLDADWYFGMVTEIVRVMHRCDSFPEAIVAGIGYPHEESSLEQAFQETARLRARDLTPVKDEKVEKLVNERLQRDDVTTGGGDLFLRFIQCQLMSFVENQYRVSPSNKTIVGHSFGGLFVLFALFHQTQLFNNYVAASPSLWYGNQITFDYERSFFEKNKDIPVQLYLAAGMLEESPEHGMASNMIKLTALLKSRGCHNLTLFSKIFNECDHCAAVAPEIQNGLQMVFARKEQKTEKAEEPQIEASNKPQC